MKVVINACFGGFSLSFAGVKRYAEIKGLTLYPYRDHISMKHFQSMDEDMLVHWSTEPTPDGSAKHNGEYWSCYAIARDDPALVQVVEEMGAKADGSCAELRVVEIPDDVEWEIDEYDGFESVHEKHRSWS